MCSDESKTAKVGIYSIPVEIFDAIVEDCDLSSRDILNLSTTCKSIRISLRTRLFEKLRIPDINKINGLATEIGSLRIEKGRVKSINIGNVTYFQTTAKSFFLSCTNLHNFTFSFSSPKIERGNHFLLLLHTVLQLPNLKKLSANITRSHSSNVALRNGHPMENIDFATSTRGTIPKKDILYLIANLKRLQTLKCQLYSLKLTYYFSPIHGFLDPTPHWNELLLLLSLLGPCVRDLEALEVNLHFEPLTLSHWKPEKPNYKSEFFRAMSDWESKNSPLHLKKLRKLKWKEKDVCHLLGGVIRTPSDLWENEIEIHSTYHGVLWDGRSMR